MTPQQFHKAACKIAGPTYEVKTEIGRWQMTHLEKQDPASYSIYLAKGGRGGMSVSSPTMRGALSKFKTLVKTYGEQQ